MAPIPETRENLSRDVDAALAAQTHPRDWPRALRESLIREETGDNLLETRFLLVVGLVIVFATVLIDLVVNPATASHGLMLRLIFVVPISLIGLILGTAERRWIAPVAMCASQIAFALVVTHLSFHMPVASANRYLMSTAILLGLSNLLFQMQFARLALYNAAYIIAQTLLISIQGEGGLAGYFDFFGIILGVSFGTLAMSERVSRLQSRNYLLRKRHEFAAEELQAANRLLQELSDCDPLTGLSNRRHFERLFAEEFAQDSFAERARNPVSVMMIDVDRFKDFNDRHGHQAGDKCLCSVALLIDHLAGISGGFAARFGGEEFIVCVPHADARAMMRFAEEIRQAIGNLPPVLRDSPDSTVTASVGAAFCTDPAMVGLDQIIGHSDEALYQAKRMGRNRVVQFQRQTNVVKLHA